MIYPDDLNTLKGQEAARQKFLTGAFNSSPRTIALADGIEVELRGIDFGRVCILLRQLRALSDRHPEVGETGDFGTIIRSEARIADTRRRLSNILADAGANGNTVEDWIDAYLVPVEPGARRPLFPVRLTATSATRR